jgi:dTDP-4-amino-4,6-dideoxygalactose transaminase
MLRERYGSREVLLTDSGTSALAIALGVVVAARPDRPQVALPAWGCYDLATAADLANIGVVLYDLDPASLGPDWASLNRALATGVAGVVVVHAYGLPVNLAEVTRLASAAGALVIEDAAQAIGARLGDRLAGALGSLGVLSFGRGKGWTGGGGGALLLNAGAPASLVPPASETLGRSRAGVVVALKLTAQWLLARPETYAIPAALPFLQLGKTVYRRAGPAARVSPTVAATVLTTAPFQEGEADQRRNNAQRLIRAVDAAGAGRVPLPWGGGLPGWLRLPLLPTDPVLRRATQPAASALGILPAYPIPLSRLPGFTSRVGGASEGFPGAEDLSRRLQTLPTHSLLRESDLARLEGWLAGR